MTGEALHIHPDSTQTILSLFEAWANFAPDKVAITCLKNGEQVEEFLTYADIKAMAHATALALRSAGCKQGECVLIILPEGKHFIPAFLGTLYAGAIAVPVPAPDAMRGKRSLPRLQAIASDAQAKYFITLEGLIPSLPAGPQITYIAADTLEATVDELKPAAEPDDCAYLQYTSGSTGQPKGVMISHRNVVSNIRSLGMVLGYDENSIGLTWMPHTHDFGLVDGLLRPLCEGVPNFVMSPGAFIRQPMRWLRAISTFQITHSAGAAFAYQQCITAIEAEPPSQLNLSSWKVAPVGAEPIKADLMEAFNRTFAPYGLSETTLCPCYGLAEATLMATASHPSKHFTAVPGIASGRQELITGCGTPWDDAGVCIVDPTSQRPLGEGDIGEIWVTGTNVSTGYWGKPEETSQVFGCALAGDTSETRYLRTGDMGFLNNGELFITGRIKDLVIIHGQNYFPTDIEWAFASAHPAIASGARAAYSLSPETDTDDAERVCIACEVTQKGLSEQDYIQIVSAIRSAVSEEFQFPVHEVSLLRRGTLPKTTSGKVQRKQCAAGIQDGTIVPLLRWKLETQPADAAAVDKQEGQAGDVYSRVSAAFAAALNCSTVADSVGFFAMGGNSIRAVQLVDTIQNEFGIEYTLENLVLAPTVLGTVSTVQRLSGIHSSSPTAQVRTPTDADDDAQLGLLKAAMHAVVQPNAVTTMRDLTPRLPNLSRLEKLVLKLPHSLACSTVEQLVKQEWARTRYWQKATDIVRRFHAVINTQVSEETLVSKSLYYGLLNKYGLDLSATGVVPPGCTNPIGKLVGTELLNSASEQNAGILIVPHHSLASCWLPKTEMAKISQTIIFGVDQLKDYEALNLEIYGPALYAKQYDNARNVLRSGGTVILAPDGAVVNSHQEVPFHNRIRSVSTGFAELAVDTGARVLQLFSCIREDGSVEIEFNRFLEIPAGLQTREEKIHALIQQYYAGLEIVWREMPWTVFWHDMQKHIARRQVE